MMKQRPPPRSANCASEKLLESERKLPGESRRDEVRVGERNGQPVEYESGRRSSWPLNLTDVAGDLVILHAS